MKNVYILAAFILAGIFVHDSIRYHRSMFNLAAAQAVAATDIAEELALLVAKTVGI